MSTTGPLTLEDIADQRAYERERDEFRSNVIAAKKLRRVSVGPVVTLVFESRLTIRFQVQEMARAEKMVTDEQIQHELDVYNRLLPTPGELSATLFIELTSEEELRTWLPRLVGIESACQIRIGQRGRPHRGPLGGRVDPSGQSDPGGDHLRRPLRALPVHRRADRRVQCRSGVACRRPSELPRGRARRRTGRCHPERADGRPRRGLSESPARSGVSGGRGAPQPRAC